MARKTKKEKAALFPTGVFNPDIDMAWYIDRPRVTEKIKTKDGTNKKTTGRH